jgi:hypothetical protein
LHFLPIFSKIGVNRQQKPRLRGIRLIYWISADSYSSHICADKARFLYFTWGNQLIAEMLGGIHEKNYTEDEEGVLNNRFGGSGSRAGNGGGIRGGFDSPATPSSRPQQKATCVLWEAL